jgi:hypothetical protein
MIFRKLRIAWSVFWGIACVIALSVSGCSHNNQDNKLHHQENKFQKTNAFTRFKKIESIKVEWLRPPADKPVVCTIPESEWNAFASLFEQGVRDPNIVKRDSWGNLEIVADGKKHRWGVLTISENECGLFISIEELWAGIRTSAIDDFVKRCVKEHN